MDFTQIAQYGLAGAALAVVSYVLIINTRQVHESKTSKEIKELTKTLVKALENNGTREYRELVKTIENNEQAVVRLCILIEQQGVFMQRLMERLDALWERTISKD